MSLHGPCSRQGVAKLAIALHCIASRMPLVVASAWLARRTLPDDLSSVAELCRMQQSLGIWAEAGAALPVVDRVVDANVRGAPCLSAHPPRTVPLVRDKEALVFSEMCETCSMESKACPIGFLSHKERTHTPCDDSHDECRRPAALAIKNKNPQDRHLCRKHGRLSGHMVTPDCPRRTIGEANMETADIPKSAALPRH